VDLKNKIEYLAGEVCKVLFPIRVDVFQGHGSKVSVCTLSSIDLLIKISKMDIMNNLLIAGRLHSENKGIDKMINYCIAHAQLEYVILCGKDTVGHYPGNALINLIENGVDRDGRINGSLSPLPFICSDNADVEKFRKQITIIDMRNCFDTDKISKTVYRLLGKQFY
jgi:tetrahydromethanopterin S-methyltransferase subunit A